MGFKINIKVGPIDLNKALATASDGVDAFVNDPLGQVVSVATDIWEFNWDYLLNPIIEPIANFMGFTEEDVVAVATQYVPLQEELSKFSIVDNVILKSAIQRRASVSEEMRNILLEGRHTNYRSYLRYGKDGYYYGLPTLSVSKTHSFRFTTYLVTALNRINPTNPVTEAEKDNLSLLGSFELSSSFTSSIDANFYVYLDWFRNNLYKDNLNQLSYLGYTWDIDSTSLSTTTTGADVSYSVELVRYVTDAPTTSSSTTSGACTATDSVDVTTETLDGGKHIKVSTVTTTYATNALATEPVTYECVATTTTSVEHTYYETMAKTLVGVVQPGIQLRFTPYGRFQMYADGVHHYDFIGAPEGLSDTELQNIDSYNETVAEFLPIIPIKSLGVWANASPDAIEYTTSVKLAKTLGIKLDDFIEQLKEQAANDTNTDEDNVQTTAITVGVDIRSDSKPEKKYIYAFMELLYYTSTVTRTQHENPESYTDSEGDVVEEEPPVNLFTIEEQLINLGYSYSWVEIYNRTASEVPTEVSNANLNTGECYIIISAEPDVDSAVRAFKKTDVGYSEVHVQNLVAVSTIGVVGTKEVGLAPQDLTGTKNKFILPVSEGLMQEFTVFERETIFSQSMYLTVYSGQFTTLEWYQTPSFISFAGLVLQVIGLFLALPTGGESIVITEALLAILYAVAVNIVIMYVLELALVYFKDDEKMQMVAAILAAVASGYFTGNWEDTSNAVMVLQGIALGTTYAGTTLNYQMKVEQDKFDKYMEEINAKLDDVEQTNEELFAPNIIAKLNELETIETPEQFEVRTTYNPTDLLVDTDILVSSDISAFTAS